MRLWLHQTRKQPGRPDGQSPGTVDLVASGQLELSRQAVSCKRGERPRWRSMFVLAAVSSKKISRLPFNPLMDDQSSAFCKAIGTRFDFGSAMILQHRSPFQIPKLAGGENF